MLKELTEKLDQSESRLAEVEVEFNNYRTNTQIEIIELKNSKEQLDAKLAGLSGYDELVAQLKETQYKLAEKEEEIEKVRSDYKNQLAKKQEEISDHIGQLTVKDEYIKDLEQQNDDFRGEMEKIGLETFIQQKNDLFKQEQINDRLADRKQYLPIYEEFEKETALLMEKYSQQESIIQNLKKENEELMMALDHYEGQPIDMQSMTSAGTEMVLASDGNMSMGGQSFQSQQVRGKFCWHDFSSNLWPKTFRFVM